MSSAMASDSPSSQAASTYLSAHTNEMVELQHLNGRLTSYIERLHFLEQQNQTLAAEVKRLRGRKLTRFERYESQVGGARWEGPGGVCV